MFYIFNNLTINNIMDKNRLGDDLYELKEILQEAKDNEDLEGFEDAIDYINDMLMDYGFEVEEEEE